MSAINDALRRASTAAKTNPGAPFAPPTPPTPLTPPSLPPSGAALPPIITVPPGLASALPGEKKRSKAPMVLAILFLFLVAGAGAAYFFGKKYFIAQAREKLARAQEEMSTNNEELAALFAEAKAAAGPATNGAPHDPPPVKVQPAVAVRPPEPQPRQTPPAATPAPVPQAPVTPRAPVHFPPLRLQSIFYRPANPCVMINGKTLFVEDEINGVIVADIQPASVTLVLSGQTNILTLR